MGGDLGRGSKVDEEIRERSVMEDQPCPQLSPAQGGTFPHRYWKDGLTIPQFHLMCKGKAGPNRGAGCVEGWMHRHEDWSERLGDLSVVSSGKWQTAGRQTRAGLEGV